MSDGIDISCFSCSRKRPQLLKDSILKMYDLANRPENIEYVVRIDDDDLETKELLLEDDELKAYEQIRIYIGPRVGYTFLWLLFKQLMEVLRGDIFVPYTDDSLMVLDGWDDIFLQFRGKPVVIGYRGRMVYTREVVQEHSIIRDWNNTTGGTDDRIRHVATRGNFYVPIQNWYQKRQPRDETNREAQGAWRLKDLSILDTLKLTEFKRQGD